MVNVRIVGVGHYLPEDHITNAALAGKPVYKYDADERVGEARILTEEGIVRTTGIEVRRRAARDEYREQLGARALQIALENAGVAPDHLEYILIATESPPNPLSNFPSAGAVIKDSAKALHGGAGDGHYGCAGFPVQIMHAVNLLSPGGYAAVVATETLTKMVEDDDINRTLFGDGAGAAILHRDEGDIANLRRDVSGIHGAKISLYREDGDMSSGIYATYHFTDTTDGKKDIIYQSPKGNIMMPDGGPVLRSAVREMFEVAETLKSCLGWKSADLYVPHQANQRILDGLLSRLGVPKEKMLMNINVYGNMSAATNAVGLSEAMNGKRVKPGDKVIVCSVGAGVNVSGFAMVV